MSSQYCLTGIENDQQHFEEQLQVQSTAYSEQQHHPPVFAVFAHSRCLDLATKNEETFVDAEHQSNPGELETGTTHLDLGEASDVSLLMNSSTMEELMSHLTSSPCTSNNRQGVPLSPISFLAAEGEDQDQLLANISGTGADPRAEPKTAVPQTSEVAIPIKHCEEELVQSSAAEPSASPQQNLEKPVNHRQEEPDEQRTAFDDKVKFRELEERKRGTRKRKRNPRQWKRTIRKLRKAKGEEHVNSTGKSVPAKEVLPFNCNCRFKCTESFNDENRRNICAEYHALADYDRQKDYILQNVVIRQVQSRKVLSRDDDGKEDYSQSRQVSVTYYLEHFGSRRRVCKGFFMKTLCISNRSIMTAIEGRSTSGVFTKTDGRGRQPSVNKTDDEHRQAVKDHIQSFLTVESLL